MTDARRVCLACSGERSCWRGQEYGNGPCPACKGEGRISDRMPVADAVADAETVYLNRSMMRFPLNFDANRAMALYAAILGYTQDLKGHVMRTANDTFRAFPGLMG